MKCPRCWAEKAYMRKATGFQGLLLSCALLVPMKCHHCYHKFVLSWFFTIREQIDPPQPRILPMSRAIRSANAQRHGADNRTDKHQRKSGRADAA